MVTGVHKEVDHQRRMLGATAMASILPTAASAASEPQAPSVSKGHVNLRLVAAWPDTLSGPAHILKRMASKVKAMSGGTLTIEVVFANQTKLSALQLFDAVASGEIDMAHSTAYYWTSRSSAFNFFSTVPFGMMAVEHYGWLRHGGGYALWHQLCAQRGVVPMPCGNTGVQMGGWMTKPITSLASVKGLKIRYPGLGGEIFKALGAQPVTLPAVDIKPALLDGRLDGAEWVAPWSDLEMGLQDVCDYYYAPGFHEPGHTLELLINQSLWDKLSPSHRAIMESYCWGEFIETQAHFYAENARALDRLRAIKKLQILRFPNDVVKEYRKKTPDVIRNVVEGDAFARTVYESYYAYLRQQLRWAELSDRAYWQARYI